MNDQLKNRSSNIDKMAAAANKKKAREQAEEFAKRREAPKKISLDPPAKQPFNDNAKKKPEVQGQETLDRIAKIKAEIEEAQRAKPTYKSPAR